MPTFEQNIKIISSYRVRVEAADEYEADQKIAEMGNDEIATYHWKWTERERDDFLPEEVSK